MEDKKKDCVVHIKQDIYIYQDKDEKTTKEEKKSEGKQVLTEYTKEEKETLN